MKHVSFVFLLAVVGVSVLGSRKARAQSLDLRAGWVRSGFGGERVVERSGLNGASLGLALVFPVTSRLSLQPELQVMQKGGTRRSSGFAVAGGDTTFSRITNPLRLLYADVPILARFELSARPDGVRPYVSAGPYVGWLLHCSSYLVSPAGDGVSPGAPGDSVEVGSACIHDGTRRPEIGIAAGTGVRLPLGTVTGVVHLRYEQGLSSVVKGLWGDAYNRALSITAGLSLPFGGGPLARRR